MIFTIYEDSDQIFQALRLGASGYLLKNSPPAKIVEALHELQNSGAPMSAAIAKKVIATFQSPTLPSTRSIRSPPVSKKF